ncbi:MAG: glycosyltransferase [Nanoarchaeota archaeon]
MLKRNENFQYQRNYPKISGYATVYNALHLGYPVEESVLSMLGFADEVVIVDGVSNDGTYELLQKLAEKDNRLKLYQNEWDWAEPGIDGQMKAFARALCESEFCWQQDIDEVVHEDDYQKIKMCAKKFPKDTDILHLPVIDLWGTNNEVTGRKHHWKWRLSRNKPEITHGIQKDARLLNDKTGKTYSKKGMSDGCFYINVMTNEMLPHKGFWSQELDMIRNTEPEKYMDVMNNIFNQLPSVFHYSWFNLKNKINQLKKGGTWDKLWSLLYQEESQERFPGVETEEQIAELAKHLYEQGGEDSDQIKYKFKLLRSQPAVMKNWIEKNREKYE